jgi:hypothetical protein
VVIELAHPAPRRPVFTAAVNGGSTFSDVWRKRRTGARHVRYGKGPLFYADRITPPHEQVQLLKKRAAEGGLQIVEPEIA